MTKYSKKLIILTTIIIIIIIVGLVIGLTYAFFTAGIVGNEEATPTVIETANLKLIFDDTQEIFMTNILPGATQTKTFTVTNISNVKLKYDINLINVFNTFINDELVFSLTSTNDGAQITDIPFSNTDKTLVSSIEINPNITQVYTMTIKFKETGTNQNYNQNAEFIGKLQINTGKVFSENVTFEIESTVGQMYKGENMMIGLTGSYYGDVSCDSSNEYVAECDSNQDNVTIMGKNRGLADITVREDTKNIELMYSVRVLETVLELPETAGEVFLTKTKTINILGQDYGALSCETSNASIATCLISGNILSITGTGLGTTTIKIKEDNKNLEVNYTITVKDVTLGLVSTNGNIFTGNNATIEITGSNYGILSCLSANETVASCSISGTNLIVNGLNAGSATITVKESELNKSVTYSVNVMIPSLYNKILTDNTAVNDSSLDFSGILGNGLYFTNNVSYGEDSTKIYYFRGNVSNNWVSFAGYLWRIVRTTSEGGVKLAYSGNGSGSTSAFINTLTYFNSTASGKYYTGYTYNTSGYTGTQTNSTIKTAVDNWYNSNLASYAAYLSTTAVFCADRSNETVSGSNRYFPAYDRLQTNKRPTFGCPTTNQSRYTASTSTGNGYLTKPIALLSADEIAYAGLVLGGANNSSSYIMANANDITSNWWTMTPYALLTSTAAQWYVNVMGSISANNVNTQFSVRPAIALKSCVIVTGGLGTKASPYTISNSNC